METKTKTNPPVVAKEKGNRDEQVSPKVNCGLWVMITFGVGRFISL